MPEMDETRKRKRSSSPATTTTTTTHPTAFTDNVKVLNPSASVDSVRYSELAPTSAAASTPTRTIVAKEAEEGPDFTTPSASADSSCYPEMGTSAEVTPDVAETKTVNKCRLGREMMPRGVSGREQPVELKLPGQ